jgi:hypothetical protein
MKIVTHAVYLPIPLPRQNKPLATNSVETKPAPSPSSEPVTGLTADQKEVCRLLGISEELYRNTKPYGR